MSNDCSILQKMPALYKRETAKMPEEPQPVEENVELTTKIFVTTEEEVKEGKTTWNVKSFVAFLSLWQRSRRFFIFVNSWTLCKFVFTVGTMAVTESAGKNFETQVENLGKELAEEMGIPTWGLVAILIGKGKRTINIFQIERFSATQNESKLK